ncbi:MAG: glutathione S-transferase family protein [Myxococcota bacterium]
MDMTLYQADLSPYAARVRIQLRAKGIEEKVKLELPPGGMSSDEYKQINPTGKIPALRIGDTVISESATICELLEDLHPEPPLLPADPVARAQVRMLVRLNDLYVCSPMFKTLPHLGSGNREWVQTLASEVETGLQWVDSYRIRSGRAGSEFAIGDALSLADCALVGALFFVERFAIPVLKLEQPIPAKLADYNEQIKLHPICARTLEEMDAAFRAKMGQ